MRETPRALLDDALARRVHVHLERQRAVVGRVARRQRLEEVLCHCVRQSIPRGNSSVIKSRTFLAEDRVARLAPHDEPEALRLGLLQNHDVGVGDVHALRVHVLCLPVSQVSSRPFQVMEVHQVTAGHAQLYEHLFVVARVLEVNDKEVHADGLQLLEPVVGGCAVALAYVSARRGSATHGTVGGRKLQRYRRRRRRARRVGSVVARALDVLDEQDVLAPLVLNFRLAVYCASSAFGPAPAACRARTLENRSRKVVGWCHLGVGVGLPVRNDDLGLAVLLKRALWQDGLFQYAAELDGLVV